MPSTICKSVSGEVSSSSIVPERFSSEYVRIVMSGSTNSATTLTFWSSGRIAMLLTLICPWPGMPICRLICMNIVIEATKK